jgi:1,4-dihydroxy-2-naphthoyl-CoA hydrolase
MTDDTDFAAQVDAITDGWKTTMGVRFVRATAHEVIAELVVAPIHLQPLGIVHGGVHAGLVEAVASIGANVTLIPKGQYAVGLENHTSFLRAVRQGTLRAVGRPIHSGRESALWEVSIADDKGRIVATGRVRLHVIDQGKALAGRGASIEGEPPR